MSCLCSFFRSQQVPKVTSLYGLTNKCNLYIFAINLVPFHPRRALHRRQHGRLPRTQRLENLAPNFFTGRRVVLGWSYMLTPRSDNTRINDEVYRGRRTHVARRSCRRDVCPSIRQPVFLELYRRVTSLLRWSAGLCRVYSIKTCSCVRITRVKPGV